MRIAFTHNLQTSHDEAQAEFDREETVSDITAALSALGHDVTRVNVSMPPAAVVSTLARLRPDLVFNTAEGSHGRLREAFYPALFEQLGLPFTGSDAYVCALTLDKQLSKMVVAQAGVPTPRWVFVDDGNFEAVFANSLDLNFPVIAKPNFEGSSKGITQNSVVEDPKLLKARVREILNKYPTGLLIEEFIVGRDVVVPYLQTVGVLSPVSYLFDEAVVGKRKYVIYDYDLKCVSSDAVTVQCPAPLDDALTSKIKELSTRAFRALGIRDLGRIDWRIADDGRVYFLEVNALPSLEPGAGIYLASALAGMPETKDVLRAVVASAAHRHGLSDVPQTFARARRWRVGFTYNVKRKAAAHADDDDSEAEYDSEQTIANLADTIAQQSHQGRGVQVVRMEANRELPRTIVDAHVDLVFNLSEGQYGRGRESHTPALLEMLQIPFTGSDAVTMALALDKGLAKTVVAGAGLATARHCVMRTAKDTLPSLAYPLVVKPNAEGSSKGMQPKCVVTNERDLRALVHKLAGKYAQDVLVEEFLPGREFTVGLVGDVDNPRILPPMEIVFVAPDTPHPIYAFGDKLDWTKKIRYDRPAVVDAAMLREIEALALGAWRALGCRDVARIDMRQDARGQMCFIEANPLPGLTPGWSDLCLIADSAGLSYSQLIASIMAPAFARIAQGPHDQA